MGCCFYDLCSPRRKIYGKQSAGDQSQSPWFNKHSLISRHQGQTREGAVEGSHRKPAARQEVVEGAEGRGGQLDPVSAHLFQAQPLSHLLGGGGDLATNHHNGLYMLLRVLPECQEPLLLKLQKKKSQNETGEGSPGMWGSREGEGIFSASRQPGAEVGLACWVVHLTVFSAVAFLQWQPLGRCRQDGIKGRDGQGSSGTPQTRAEQEGRQPGAQSEVLLGI